MSYRPNAVRYRVGNTLNGGQEFPVDVSLDKANVNEYDALLFVAGGVMNPDKLRTSK